MHVPTIWRENRSKPTKKKILKLTMPKKQLTAWEIAKPILEREFLAGNIKADWPRMYQSLHIKLRMRVYVPMGAY